MKSCIKCLLLCAACTAVLGSTVFADAVVIGSRDKTTAVKVTDGEFEVIEKPDSNGIAITKDGILIISPDAYGKMTVENETGQNEINVLPAVIYDFETEAADSEYVQFSGERAEGGDGFYSVGGALDVSAMKLAADSVKLSFDFCKNDTGESDLLSLTADGEIIAQITLNRRTNEKVYLSYLENGKMVRMRDVTYDVGEWFAAEAYIDFDARTVELYIDGSLILTAPISDFDMLSELAFGACTDNIVLMSGEAVSESGIEIGLESADIPAEGVYVIDPQVKIKLNDSWHSIGAEYVSFNTDGTGIMPSEGMIVADSAAEVTITCVAVVSGVEYKAEKTVTVTESQSEGTECEIPAVYEPTVGDGRVKLRVLNGEGMNLKIIVCLTDGEGAMDFTAEDWTVESADALKELEADGESLAVYLIDTDSGANLLQQEGV